MLAGKTLLLDKTTVIRDLVGRIPNYGTYSIDYDKNEVSVYFLDETRKYFPVTDLLKLAEAVASEKGYEIRWRR